MEVEVGHCVEQRPSLEPDNPHPTVFGVSEETIKLILEIILEGRKLSEK